MMIWRNHRLLQVLRMYCCTLHPGRSHTFTRHLYDNAAPCSHVCGLQNEAISHRNSVLPSSSVCQIYSLDTANIGVRPIRGYSTLRQYDVASRGWTVCLSTRRRHLLNTCASVCVRGLYTSCRANQLKDSHDGSEASRLLAGLLSGDRAYLARVITLVESWNTEKRALGQSILSEAMQHLATISTGHEAALKASNGESGCCEKLAEGVYMGPGSTFRLGISGPPGAGKSTFIEAFGSRITGATPWGAEFSSNAVLATPRSRFGSSVVIDTSAPSSKLAKTQRRLEKKTLDDTTHSTVANQPISISRGMQQTVYSHTTHRLAVLAIDPSSQSTGGSLLADKTRMPLLAVDPLAFVRPSPSSGHLGGVTRASQEALLLCEAAGHNVVLIETVGVGQSEFAVADMVDMFVLILPPAGGDELQGLKRGIVEMADVVLVNKADGDLLPAARRIATEYMSALKFMRPRRKDWKPIVMLVSSLTGDGIEEFWSLAKNFFIRQKQTGELELSRKQQMKIWMWNYVRDGVMQRFHRDPVVRAQLDRVEKEVFAGRMTPGNAAEHLLTVYTGTNFSTHK